MWRRCSSEYLREAKDEAAQPHPHKHKVTLCKNGCIDFSVISSTLNGPEILVHYLMFNLVKIGRPGYRVTKQYDPETKQRSLLFQIEYPEIEDNTKPRHRFMSAFEQRMETCDKRYQYLLFAAEPYEIISFKVPSTEIDKSTPKFFSHWDPDIKTFTLQLYFKTKPPEGNKLLVPPAPGADGTTAPGVPPRTLPMPMPMPPQSQAPPPPPPPSSQGGPPSFNPPRPPPPGSAPPMGTIQPPPPPPMTNGYMRPVSTSMPQPMGSFTPGVDMGRPPMQGFPGQQMQAQGPPPPQANMGR